MNSTEVCMPSSGKYSAKLKKIGEGESNSTNITGMVSFLVLRTCSRYCDLFAFVFPSDMSLAASSHSYSKKYEGKHKNQ